MSNRRWGLDLLRAIAILVVVEQHGRFISDKLGSKLQMLGVTDGVDLFFVLSGFLIGGILIKSYSAQNELRPQSFWMRRWLRTLPIYFVALFVNIIFMRFIFKYGFSKRDMLYHFAFIQNILPPYSDFRFFPEAWSLSIEEFFYLSLPLIIIAVIYIGKNRNVDFVFIASLSCLIIFSLGIRAFEYHNLRVDEHTLEELNNSFRIIIPERLDSLAVGVFAAYFRNSYVSLWNNSFFRWTSLIIGAIMLILLDRTQIYSGRISLSFFAFVPYFFIYSVSVSLILPFLDTWQPGNNLFTKGISQISKQSYSMYLFHESLIAAPFTRYAGSLTSEHLKIGLYVLYWILVFGISYFTYSFIEKPILDYRDKKYLTL